MPEPNVRDPDPFPGPAEEERRDTWAVGLAVGAGLATVLGTWGVLVLLVA